MEVMIFSGIYSVKAKLYSQRVFLVTASIKTTAILETKTGHHTDRQTDRQTTIIIVSKLFYSQIPGMSRSKKRFVLHNSLIRNNISQKYG
jgi:hypothetical protein